MKVRKLTIEQKDILISQKFTTDSYFNPIQDFNDNWIISNEEVNQCTNSEFCWVKDLIEIEFEPIINERPF